MLDEAHYIKNPTGVLAGAARSLALARAQANDPDGDSNAS